jgi:hypothetical protein
MVAVKVLRPELAAVLGAERFVQEIKTTANEHCVSWSSSTSKKERLGVGEKSAQNWRGGPEQRQNEPT